jgi:hypothetical protein
VTAHVKFALYITLDHVSGPEQDADTMLDALAYSIGAENGAGTDALRVVVADYDETLGDIESVYRVRLVDNEP